MKPKIVSIVGARPQFIKLAALGPVLSKSFHHTIVHTGQHFDDNMSGLFFRQLRIPRADRNLGIDGGSHGAMTGRMLVRIEKALLEEAPDFALTYGDTNSTLAGALAAAKLSIPVGHVEAGMRSFVPDMPEEINRKLTDHVSEILFCPTPTAVKNVRAEGIRKRVVLSGDIMYELLDHSRTRILTNDRILKEFKLKPKGFLLLTVHRAATVDSRTNCEALLDIIRDLPLPVLFPAHPRTRKRLRQFKLTSALRKCRHLRMTAPMGYVDTLAAAARARVVLTDSGGLQKESLFLGTPALILRDETEWVETLKQGNHLVGLDRKKIRRLMSTRLTVRRVHYRIRGRLPSAIIIDELSRFLAVEHG
ncbi:MAG: UDP-N-acetylglucosamine 2-epimerase (non-hydrolyzing) [Candidatus Zixiibacteriota bacterium]